MNQVKLKHTLIENSVEFEYVEYSGCAEKGLRISLREDDFLDIQVKQINELMTIMAEYNPLLADLACSKPSSSPARFQCWVEKNSLPFFGRQLTTTDALLIRSVFGAEGVLKFGYTNSGVFLVGDFPHASPIAAINECVARVCIYQEKGLYLRAKLVRVTHENEYVSLELLNMPTPGFSSRFKKLKVGGTLNYLSIRHGRLTNCMPSWRLITNNEQVEYLTHFAATMPDAHIFRQELLRLERNVLECCLV